MKKNGNLSVHLESKKQHQQIPFCTFSCFKLSFEAFGCLNLLILPLWGTIFSQNFLNTYKALLAKIDLSVYAKDNVAALKI